MQTAIEQMMQEAKARLKLTKENFSTSEEDKKEYECEVCKDEEFIFNREDNVAIPCKCREVKKYNRMLQASGISEGFKTRTFNTYNPRTPEIKRAKEMSMEYVVNFDEISKSEEHSIAFLGQVGAGKTHLTIAIANELMKRNIGVRYLQYREDIPRLKQLIIDEHHYSKEMGSYKNAGVLIIDDLYKFSIQRNDFTGQERVNPADERVLFEIINHRYFNGKPIIFSSELTVEKLLSLDEAMNSRIIEKCKGHIFEFKGKELNYRLHG